MDIEKIFQVSEFNEFVDLCLKQVGEVVVEGEISQINVSQNKWLYITIKDKESCVEVFGTIYNISGYKLLEQGMLVHVYGTPGLYKKAGKFSIRAERIVPAGEGALRLAFEKLKLKLEREGLFDPQRKRQQPIFPEKIGLITAKDSRAYSDFIKVLTNRMGGLKISFYPVSVQGKDSVDAILKAFSYFNNRSQDFDLLVLARGGGSLDDLQSFNDERVAKAIFLSKIPVVCAVGHEEDISIADLAADVRASTPSNAAELIVRNRIDVIKDVNYSAKIIETYLRQLLNEKNQLIYGSVSILKNAISQEISYLRRVIDRFNTRLMLFTRDSTSFALQVSVVEKRLLKTIDSWVAVQKTGLASLTRLLENLNPYRVLERGYSITLDKNGSLVKSIKNVEKGEIISTTLFDGKISSLVTVVKGK